jgi:hypothetical protein
VLERDAIEFIEAGCALIVGTVDAHGAPLATRGWGADVLDAAAGRLQLLLSADDVVVNAGLTVGMPIAITGADVPSLRSIQLKGHVVVAPLPPTDADRERSQRYREAFFSDISLADGIDRDVIDRLAPRDVVRVVVAVEELFDQTPGPTAGAALPGGR